MFGKKGSMNRLQINKNICYGDIFVPDQLFAFDNIVLHANATEHLDSVESFSLNQVIMFGSLEYTANSYGDLSLSGWRPNQLEISLATMASTSEPASDLESGLDLMLDPTLSVDLTTISSDLDLKLDLTSEPAPSSDPITSLADQELALAGQSSDVASGDP